MDIKQILIDKYNEDQLGHFYILSPNRNTEDSDFLFSWSEELLKNILNTKQIINHQDFLEIRPTKKKYSLDDFSELFSFLNYKATVAKRKFILIHDADKFTTNVSNKLLKTLEEPPVKTSIILLNPKGSTLLQTISSRGIKLRIPIEKEMNLEEEFLNLKNLSKLPLHSLIENLKSKIENHETTLIAITAWCNNNAIQYNVMKQLQVIQQEYQEDLLYHNPPTHRLYALATLIKELPF